MEITQAWNAVLAGAMRISGGLWLGGGAVAQTLSGVDVEGIENDRLPTIQIEREVDRDRVLLLNINLGPII